MSENLSPYRNHTEFTARQIRFPSVDTTLLAEDELGHIAHQVNNLVRNHNIQNPNQMYERSSDQLVDIMKRDRAVVFADIDLTVAYFGLINEQLLPDEVDILEYQLVELGNSIANPDYRGHGLAAQGTVARIEKAFQHFGENTILYCTTENPKVVRSYGQVNKHSNGRWKLESLPFNHMPYFAGRTCIYSECGLDPSHVCSEVRRPAALSSKEQLSAIADESSKMNSMHCTLVVSDAQKALEYQRNCIEWHPRVLPSVPVSGLTDGDLTGEDIRNVAKFYEQFRMFATGQDRPIKSAKQLLM